VEYLHRDTRVDEAEERLVRVIRDVRVATDRELKVRLERDFFPWVTSRALERLLRKGVIQKIGYPGRPSRSGGTEAFYVEAGTSYDEVQDLVRRKRCIANTLRDLLTGVSEPATHAENLFYDAFIRLGFTVHGRDVTEFRGRKAQGVAGREPPNIDFVIERDGLIYGVDIKNWIRYEYDSRNEIENKVRVALSLRTVPWIIARYIDKDTIYTTVHGNKGVAYPYGTLLLPYSLRSLAQDAASLLGYPVLAVDALPQYKVEWMEKLHQDRCRIRR